MALGVEKPSNKTKRCERPRQGRNGPKPINSAVDGGNVRADTGAQTQNDEQASEPTGPTELACSSFWVCAPVSARTLPRQRQNGWAWGHCAPAADAHSALSCCSAFLRPMPRQPPLADWDWALLIQCAWKGVVSRTAKSTTIRHRQGKAGWWDACFVPGSSLAVMPASITLSVILQAKTE